VSEQRYVICPMCGQERLSSPGGDLMGRHYRTDAKLGENPYCLPDEWSTVRPRRTLIHEADMSPPLGVSPINVSVVVLRAG
jgi:hypothetical protein